jgi:protoheme IX farnesyltransferase
VKDTALALPVARWRVADFVALAKPRLNLLVVLTTLAAFHLGSGPGIELAVLLHTVVGTALVASAAAALNQVMEREVDGRMRRTRKRPLPEGRLQPAEAIVFAAALGATGLAELAWKVNPLSSIVALVTLVSYLVVYTPLKPRTPLSTIVGAVPGALPPLIGWAAARGELTAGGWMFFTIVFLWQVPHFLAIAWLYRDDYERAGLPLLPVVEPDGASTGRQVLLYSAALVPASLLPGIGGIAGGWYLAGAIVLGSGFVLLGIQFARRRETAHARRLFVGSIIYLPLLWALMIATRVR